MLSPLCFHIGFSLLMCRPRHLKEEPLQPVRPIDEIEVADSHECSFVFAPLRAWNANVGLASKPYIS
jgi:hypothetical protein